MNISRAFDRFESEFLNEWHSSTTILFIPICESHLFNFSDPSIGSPHRSVSNSMSRLKVSIDTTYAEKPAGIKFLLPRIIKTPRGLDVNHSLCIANHCHTVE